MRSLSKPRHRIAPWPPANHAAANRAPGQKLSRRLFLGTGVATAIGFAGGTKARASSTTVTVFAAASLSDAMTEIAHALNDLHPDIQIRLSLAASSTLARQIMVGAPADLFISADQAWMDHLAERGLIRQESRENLLSNRLVLIGTPEMAARYRDANAVGWDAQLRLLLDDGERLAMGDPAHVPAGRYGQAALESLGLWHIAEPRLAPAQDVRAAVALVARGSAPLGIAYATDISDRSGIEIIQDLPVDSYPVIRYPLARMANSDADDEAIKKVTDFLNSDAAWAYFSSFGFERPQAEPEVGDAG